VPTRSQPFRLDRPAVAELAAGAIVVDPKENRILLLHEAVEDRWCFPKGHVEHGESLLEAARREIAEECGLTELDFRGELGEVAYRFYEPARDLNVFKTAVYFLAFAAKTGTTLEAGFDQARWADGRTAASLLRFDNDKRMLATALGKLGPSGTHHNET
jgi:8-oxo-dGTP pyrophosphatase MutT (NUDIX family)